MYVKYRPGESRDQRQIVGSKEAKEIEQAWSHEAELVTDIRHAQFASDRAAIMQRILTEEFPPGLVMFYVRFVGPLRDGDVIEARFCHDKQIYRRVMDLQASAIVAIERWQRPLTQMAPVEALIRPLTSGSTIEVIGPRGYVERHVLRIPPRWSDPWRFRDA